MAGSAPPAHGVSRDDRAFRRTFEAFEVAPADFDHRAHVRLAYVYLCEHSVEQSTELMKSSLLAFLDHCGVDRSKYHETLTRAWVMAIRHFMERSPAASSAADFIESNPELLDPEIMLTHYSAEVLFSPGARAGFIDPDRDALPEY
jgi:hypothetical protein